MNEYAYKEDIIHSRVGSVGGSDAKMLASIANNGFVPKSAYKRLAVCKGLIEPNNYGVTKAMAFGDYIENEIFAMLSKGSEEEYQSNPLWVSKKLSRENVKLICHPDIVLKDTKNNTLYVYEVKTTKFSVEETRQTYREQLYIEQLLAKEVVSEYKGRWTIKPFLVHYNTDGVDLDAPFEFDANRLTIRPYKFGVAPFDVNKAMDITSTFLSTFNEYYESDEIDYALLPQNVQTQFTQVASYLREIKEREEKVNEFKERLYTFLSERNIKKISCDDFSFTVVAPTKSVKVDYQKLFEEEIAAKTPRKAKKMQNKYKKETARKGYVVIKTKENK